MPAQQKPFAKAFGQMRICKPFCAFVLSRSPSLPYANVVIPNHNRVKVVNGMGYPVGGVGCGVGYGGYGMIGFVLVLFILLVIILRAGIFI